MQQCVTASADIETGNFFRLDITEIQGAMRTGIASPCLALESHQGNFENSKLNNSIESKTFAFMVIKKAIQGNFNEQNQFLDDCEVIGKKILARMRYHSTDINSILYNTFDLSLCNYHKVGPVFLSWYGYRFEVTLKPKKIDLKVNPGDFSDITTACLN
jgi:hypothetical protein